MIWMMAASALAVSAMAFSVALPGAATDRAEDAQSTSEIPADATYKPVAVDEVRVPGQDAGFSVRGVLERSGSVVVFFELEDGNEASITAYRDIDGTIAYNVASLDPSSKSHEALLNALAGGEGVRSPAGSELLRSVMIPAFLTSEDNPDGLRLVEAREVARSGRFAVHIGRYEGGDPSVCFSYDTITFGEVQGGCTTLLSTRERPDLLGFFSWPFASVAVTTAGADSVAFGDQDQLDGELWATDATTKIRVWSFEAAEVEKLSAGVELEVRNSRDVIFTADVLRKEG